MDQIAAEFEVKVGVIRAARRRGQLAHPDGYQLGRAWWRPSAAQWASRQVPAGAWVLAQISEYVGLRRPQGRPDFPPADGMAGTTRWWWSGTITAWWEPHAGRRVERLRARADAQDGAAPRGVDRWFGRDLAAHTGLSYEAVRTYRRLGKLPDPDGLQNQRPWRRPETIRAWDRPSATGRQRRARPRHLDSAESQFG